MDGFAQALEDRFGSPVDNFHPFKRIAFDSRKLGVQDERLAPTAAVAVGLALRKAAIHDQNQSSATERKSTKKRAAFQVGQKLTIACSLILIGTALLIGWRYWTLAKESASLDVEIANAQKEKRRGSIRSSLKCSSSRGAGRNSSSALPLIEQLRKDQKGPVHILDQVSRALPPMLWLTELKQSPNADEVLITGRCTTQTAVSDFVANLEASGYFKKSVDIVSSTTTPQKEPPFEVINFTLKAIFQQPGEAAKASTPSAAPAAKPGD